MSRFTRPAILVITPLAFGAAALAVVLAQHFAATASEDAASMSLQVSGTDITCDTPSNPTACGAEGGGDFAVAVSVDGLPEPEGYTGFQTLIYYGGLIYKPDASQEDEVVWPDSAHPLRSPLNPTGSEGTVAHTDVTSLTPPLDASTHLGEIIDLQLTCLDVQETFPLVLIAYNEAEQPLGSAFSVDGPEGSASVGAKVRGQAVLDLDGDPFTDAQTVDLADSVEITCAGPTPTPIPPNPDLVIQSMVIELETGDACNYDSTALGVRIGVANVGNLNAGPLMVDVNGAQQNVDGLAFGAKVSLWFPGYENGENSAFVDPTMQVDEQNEENNQLSQILPVPTLPLPCTATPTLTPSPSPTVTPTPAGIAGDADCNGEVTAIDAAVILQFIAALTSGLPCEELADVNESGTFDAIDVTLILQFTAGLLAAL